MHRTVHLQWTLFEKCRICTETFFFCYIEFAVIKITYFELQSHLAHIKMRLKMIFLLQSNFNGSNTFGTMKISSREGSSSQ